MKTRMSRTLLAMTLAIGTPAWGCELVAGFAARFETGLGGDGSTWAIVIASEPWAWHDARDCAQRLGADLACTPDSSSLGFAITIATDERAFDCSGPWLGGYRSAGAPWTWSTGAPFLVTAWAPGRPAQATLLDAAIQMGGLGEPDGTLIDSLPGPDAGGVTRSAIIRWPTLTDCNMNASPDQLEIALGLATDADGDGAIDGCTSQAIGDLNGDGAVNGLDLGALLGAWGSTSPTAADLNRDGVVNGVDLGVMLGNWTV
jgi:hypothetical protein